MTHLDHPVVADPPSAIPPSGARPAPPRARIPGGWRLVASGLLTASALLQLDASLQRWVTAHGSWTRPDRWIEDHLFDYAYPDDPWEPIGDAAQRYGLGMILLALALVALAVARGGTRVTSGIAALLIAGPFAASGLHAVASGLLGRPTPLAATLPAPALVQLLGVIAVGAVIVAAILARGPVLGSLPDALAVVLALGASVPGYLLATFAIAPSIHGTASYDTTPWTETVVAASTAAAAAALAMLVAAVVAARRRPGGGRPDQPADDAGPSGRARAIATSRRSTPRSTSSRRRIWTQPAPTDAASSSGTSAAPSGRSSRP